MEMATLTAQIAAWIKVPPGTESLEASKRLRQGLDKLEPKLMGKGRWNALLHSSLIARLAEFIALWQDCLALQERIDPGSAASRIKPVLQYHTVIARKQHYDYGMMLFSAGSRSSRHSWRALSGFGVAGHTGRTSRPLSPSPAAFLEA